MAYINYFKDIKIKYVDNKYIYLPTLLFTFVLLLASPLITAKQLAIFSLALLLLVLLIAHFHLYRKTVENFEFERQQIQALIAIHNLLPIKYPLPAMSKWAASPDLSVVITEIILLNKPDFIVEVGSGISSLISGYCIQKNGGTCKLLSFDHDEVFAEKTRKSISQHNLQDYCEVRYAPLIPHTFMNREWQWYDISSFNHSQKIDVLIVDGPPVKTQKMARFLALPLFYDNLSDNAHIIIDDADRESEAAVIEEWLTMYPEFNLDMRYCQKGVAVLSRNPA